MSETKKCAQCGLEKKLSEFPEDGRYLDNHRRICEDCFIENELANNSKPKEKKKPWTEDMGFPKFKVCSVCNKRKKAENFTRDARSNDGLSSLCTKCTARKHELKKYTQKDVWAKDAEVVEEREAKSFVPEDLKKAKDRKDIKINDRLSRTLTNAFGENLESIVKTLYDMIYDPYVKESTKLQAISMVLDRIIGKPVQEQLIKQEVVNVIIKRPQLTTPKEIVEETVDVIAKVTNEIEE